MAHNRIKGLVGINGQPVPKHDVDKFAGVWIPVNIFRRFWDGKISTREMVLLATIDSLIGMRGCFASNAYLAKRCRVKEPEISRMISRLKKMGLIRQIGFDGRTRTLETKWHRAEQEFSDDAG